MPENLTSADSAGILAAASEERSEVSGNDILPRFIKSEANFLRLPLFALHTKRLRTLDGLECRGKIRRDGQVHAYRLQITRNTASLYPGPLSRKVHFALLSSATERGFPLQNPITWTWRDLCRRMGVSYRGGTTIDRVKAAIRATHGIVIQTEYALFSKPQGQALPARERGYHLYSEYTFRNEPLPDGRVADVNAVCFADWYLENLNSLFSTPLDYQLWQALDRHSPIASRLYEFLLLNFYSGFPLLRINYPALAQLLPVRPKPYLSDARRQLEGAFQLLTHAAVIAAAEWAVTKDNVIQLSLHRGERLTALYDRGKPSSSSGEEMLGTVEVRELRNQRSPEGTLVSEFYRLWTGSTLAKPSPRELVSARAIIEEHGVSKAVALLPKVVKHLHQHWPEAKSFGAVVRYLPEALRDFQRDQAHHVNVVETEATENHERQAAAREAKRREPLQVLWDSLPDSERQVIQRAVLAKQPRSIQKFPDLLQRFCLDELERRRPSDQLGS